MTMQFELPPPHVAPEAADWGNSPHLMRVPDLTEIMMVCDPLLGDFPIPPDPEEEIQELLELASLRLHPGALASDVPGRERLPLSYFLQLRPQPLGAQINTSRNADTPVIANGLELARWFEAETPGLPHRHALNYLIPQTRMSPPHQARLWAALDVAIYASFLAAWHYKWQSPLIPRRERPSEYLARTDLTDGRNRLRALNVIYDFHPAPDGVGYGPDRISPIPHPGTPRHPAYPSGHSTVGGAASEICSYFFPQFSDEFDKLADNSGMARLWAGIHYRSDHTSGVAIGRETARLVIARLEIDGIVTLANPSLFGNRESVY